MQNTEVANRCAHERIPGNDEDQNRITRYEKDANYAGIVSGSNVTLTLHFPYSMAFLSFAQCLARKMSGGLRKTSLKRGLPRLSVFAVPMIRRRDESSVQLGAGKHAR